MLIIDDKLISDDILEGYFVCNLNACKGACCHEGDYGAPLLESEIEIIASIYDKIKDLLPQESQNVIENEGYSRAFNMDIPYGTPLKASGSCVYLMKDDHGIAQCAFEYAHNEGLTSFKKPISCHLYPIRRKKDNNTGYEYLNYDVWDICSAACGFGKRVNVRLFEFLKEPLIRCYGEEFYEALEDAADQMGKRLQ